MKSFYNISQPRRNSQLTLISGAKSLLWYTIMKFPKIDWPNHIVNFITTIIGIIIALSLDERWNDRETDARLREFRELLSGEMKSNIDGLENFLSYSSIHEQQLRFLLEKNINDDVIVCGQADLDSAQTAWGSNGFFNNVEKAGDNKFRVSYTVKMFEYKYENTVWESFKNTDLINHMSSEEISDLTRQYALIEKFGTIIDESKLKIAALSEATYTESDQAKISSFAYLNKVCDIMRSNNSSIDFALQRSLDK